MLYVITGPSGCGKSVLVRRMLEELENVEFSVSYTTRKKRDSEEDGKDYYFISKEEFERMIKEDSLAEWAVVHENYYGTSKREVEREGADKDVLLDIDIQGAQQIKKTFNKAIFVFILPPSFQELKKRIEKRGQDSTESIRNRLEVAKEEIKCYNDFDYIVINDQLDTAIEELKSIILSMRCRRDVRQKEIISIVKNFSEVE